MPVYCYEECVAKAATRLSGSAGPCGVEAEMLKHCLLCHGAHSERLQEAMADWVDWLSNGLPPYSAYRAVNTVWTVALDKCPGVRPLGVGKVWMRLWSDCSHMKTKAEATKACGNTSSIRAYNQKSSPTSTRLGQFGHSRRDGPRTAPQRRRMTVTRPATQPAESHPRRGCACPWD